MQTERIHEADVCVVGGGMAGLCAALAAARHGAEVVLIQDRPMFGGNASSECRVHICGADRDACVPGVRETGILEELRLANLACNPQRSFGVWDTVLYDAVRRQQGLRMLLNCSVFAAESDGTRVASVTGWQTTTYQRHTVRARVFIDASGDGALAPLVGEPFRIGREGRDEYGESLAPAAADAGTMGATLAFGARDCGEPMPFTPPSWAWRFDDCGELPGRHDYWTLGYWWIELGGMDEAVAGTERVRDDLLAAMYGVWDHIKNRCRKHSEAAANWAIDWVQFVPAKRESRRYVGRHVLVQDELFAGGPFEDTVAFGGWTIDEHPPVGIRCGRLGLRPCYHGNVPPYGIPYRSLLAGRHANLMVVGRCASCSHIAMSSTRVAATGAVMGQAAGTAAAMSVRAGEDPPALSDDVGPLQQALLADDAYLPGVRQRFEGPDAGAELAASSGDPSPLRDGVNRPVGQEEHAWPCAPGERLEIRLRRPETVRHVNLVADSDLNTRIQLSYWADRGDLTAPPPSLLREASVEVRDGDGWSPAAVVTDNVNRLVRILVGRRTDAVRITLSRTWGAERTRLFAAWVD
jgi:hypothetical protein